MVANWSLQATKSRRRKKEGYFLKNLSVALNNYLSKNEHIILFGDFKLSNTNKHFAVLMAFLSPAIRDKKSFFFKKSANKFKNTQFYIFRCFNYQNYILVRYIGIY